MKCMIRVHYLAFGDAGEVGDWFEADMREDILDRCFAWLNRGSPTERPELFEGHPSLSVGDVIEIKTDGAATMWKCEAIGWSRLQEVR